MSSQTRAVCAWCGRAGDLRDAELDGRRLTVCQACSKRLRRALDGEEGFQFMLKALRRKAADR